MNNLINNKAGTRVKVPVLLRKKLDCSDLPFLFFIVCNLKMYKKCHQMKTKTLNLKTF